MHFALNAESSFSMVYCSFFFHNFHAFFGPSLKGRCGDHRRGLKQYFEAVE